MTLYFKTIKMLILGVCFISFYKVSIIKVDGNSTPQNDVYVLFETLGNITIFCLFEFTNRVLAIRIKLLTLY